ncbi:hypothetical protein DVH24_016578 [Malus domestica]|uniref:Uncharacterized protein n=1 Tax=Malus domestica TaxID=3750 RepID=A0A498HQK6_MALDO|nr:hypothetical protein DVH24_016578 [Malus domestica]
MPGNSSKLTGTSAPVTQNLYRPFDVEAINVVYIPTEANFWDLEAVDRRKTPFVVVQRHRPMYTRRNKRGENAGAFGHLEPLFVKNNVASACEEQCNLENYTCGSMGPIHVVIGMAGQDWQSIWEPRPDHPINQD